MPLWLTITPTTFIKHQTVTKTLIFLPLKKWKGLTKWVLVPLWPTLKYFFYETPNCHQNLDMISLKIFQGINPMGLSAPLDNSYTKNCSEKPNCRQNLDIIALNKGKWLTKWALVTLWPTLKLTIVLENQTVTKTLIVLPWIQ